MYNKIKKLGCYLIIIILLPYVVTIFINGASITTSSCVDETSVKVHPEESERAKEKTMEESMLADEKEQDQEDYIEMSLEEYCIGVMARTIPLTYKEDALKAQAVLVRTETCRKIQEAGGDTVFQGGYWTEKQMEDAWGMKYASYYHKLESSWDDTEGQVLYYGEGLALTPYFRLSNGNTRDGNEVLGSDAYPYLKIVDCPLDLESEDQLLTRTLVDLDAEILSMDTAGYVLSVRVGQETVSGEEFREAYDLSSACFTLQEYDGKLRITTRGVGHGLGMSQYTASRMAEEGKDYQEILTYFFPGTEIKEVAEILMDME